MNNLSNLLNKGHIHIEKKKSPRNISPNKHKYKEFLNGGTMIQPTKSISEKLSNNKDIKIYSKRHTSPIKGSTKGENSKRINITPKFRILREPRDKKSKYKFTRKKSSKKIKDINEIEKNIETMKSSKGKPKKAQPNKVESKKVDPKKDQSKKDQPKKDQPKKDQPKKVDPKKAQPKKVESKNKNNETKKIPKGSKKKDTSKSRRVSFSNKRHRKNDIQIQKIKNEINKIRKKKTDEIKRELEKDGIKVSGKSGRLLRDIYLIQQTSGIKITHE